MAEIFISYSRDDRDLAHALAEALEAAGHAVWWDRALTGGGDFAAEIERHLLAAPLVIVLWSASSVASDFVRDESSRARDLRKLLPIRIEEVALPLGFGTLHTLDLIGWDGDPDDEAVAEVLAHVRDHLQRAKPMAASGAPGSVAGRWRRGADAADPLTQRRRQRRWLLLLGAGAAGGAGWWLIADLRREREWQRQAERRRIAQEHLNRAFDHHFDSETPDLKKAELEYRLATDADPTLAEAFFYWGHLTVLQMDRSRPKPSPAELAGLREDALDRFRRSLQLPALGRGQRAVADEQIAWLSQTEPAPLERSTDSAVVAALAGGATDRSQPLAEARPGPASPRQPSTTRPSGAGAAAGVPGSIGLGGFRAGASDVAAAAARPAPPPPPVPPRHVPAGDEVRERAEAEARALFAAERDARVAAASRLAGSPQLAAEALPIALAAAGAAMAQPALDAAARSGVGATVQLVAQATPSVVSRNRASIESLQRAIVAKPALAPAASDALLGQALQRAAGPRPAAFVQIADPRQMPLARQLLKELDSAGYATAEIETVAAARAPARPAVRSHGGSDPALARWCRNRLAAITGTEAVIQNLRDVRPDNDVFEIWFDAATCAASGREVAGCAKA